MLSPKVKNVRLSVEVFTVSEKVITSVPVFKSKSKLVMVGLVISSEKFPTIVSGVACWYILLLISPTTSVSKSR